nr:hypothetical protein [Tanacetum cinerariifolium]
RRPARVVAPGGAMQAKVLCAVATHVHYALPDYPTKPTVGLLTGPGIAQAAADCRGKEDLS